jgi:hypothetical protein
MKKRTGSTPEEFNGVSVGFSMEGASFSWCKIGVTKGGFRSKGFLEIVFLLALF